MNYLIQSFSNLSFLGKDSQECHPMFYSLKKYFINPQVLITRV
jgi:hypothetical protein